MFYLNDFRSVVDVNSVMGANSISKNIDRLGHAGSIQFHINAGVTSSSWLSKY